MTICGQDGPAQQRKLHPVGYGAELHLLLTHESYELYLSNLASATVDFVTLRPAPKALIAPKAEHYDWNSITNDSRLLHRPLPNNCCARSTDLERVHGTEVALKGPKMRALALLFAACASYGTVQAKAEPAAQPFLDTLSGLSANPLHLFKRQSCPSNYSSCSSIGDGAACCPNNTNCARDSNGNIACCPTNAVCTGVVSGTLRNSASSSSTTGFVLGGSTTAAPTITTPATLAPGYSTLTNAYYPFLIIPSSYPNSQECLSAYSSCQSASTACVNALGGSNGVTVSGLGTQGVTQAGASASLAPESASSVCNSLYTQGCYGIQSTVCSQFGSGTGGATATTGFVQANDGARAPIARCTGAFYTAAAVAGAGMAGMII